MISYNSYKILLEQYPDIIIIHLNCLIFILCLKCFDVMVKFMDND